MRTARSDAKAGGSAKFDLRPAWPVASLGLVALLLGGGGSRYGLMNFAVELFALALVLLLVPSLAGRIKELPRGLVWLIGLTIALPIIQIIPVPPAVWQAAPGGDLALESRRLVGAEGGWFPLSVFPMRTVASAAALVVPLAMILLYRPEVMSRRVILLVVAGLGGVNLLGGAMQILAGQQWVMPYPILERGRLYGFFANHNSAGLMFVISACALVGLHFDRQRELWKWLACLFFGLAFVLGAMLTQSRSSTALSLLPLTLLLLRTVSDLRPKGKVLHPAVYLGAFGAIAVAASALFFGSAKLQKTFLRFDDLEDSRPDIWADTLYSIERFWPTGSGFGTFSEVFQLDESLETLLPTVAGRAHNEYLELGVEGGILAWGLLGLWALWGLLASWRTWRNSPKVESLAVPLAFAVIALQSILDYPLRNLALLSLAGLLVAVLAGASTRSRDRKH